MTVRVDDRLTVAKANVNRVKGPLTCGYAVRVDGVDDKNKKYRTHTRPHHVREATMQNCVNPSTSSTSSTAPRLAVA